MISDPAIRLTFPSHTFTRPPTADLLYFNVATIMEFFRDDGSTASLIHKPNMIVTEDDATTVHDDLRQATSGVQVARCGMLEHCDCGSISCQSRELYALTLNPSRCYALDTDSMKLDNCQPRRRPYMSPGLLLIIGPQCSLALGSRVSAFLNLFSRLSRLSQVESCPSRQRRNLTRRSLPR